MFDGQWLWALGLLLAAALSDALDGLLARTLHQQTMLGQYLDPIADKLLLSSLFLVLSFIKKIPWKYTVVVFSRDLCIVATSVVLYATVGFRDFRPSIYGKVNTACQIGAVFFVVLAEVLRRPWVLYLVNVFSLRNLYVHDPVGRPLCFADGASLAEARSKAGRLETRLDTRTAG